MGWITRYSRQFRSAPQPIELQQFYERKEKILDELRTILKAIDGRFPRGIRVISTEYKVSLSPRPAGSVV